MLDNHQLPWTDRPFSDSDSEESLSEEPPVRRTFSFLKISGFVCASMVAGSLLLIIFLRWIPVPTTAFMLQYDLNAAPLQYQWVPWEQISSALPIAVVAAEDQNFPDHWGFDFDAIAEALNANKRRTRPRGASTISQQVAKNLFLWPGRSWLRKGIEAYFTVLIELFWPKKRILEVYLNIAEFGPGIYGVGAAGQAFFNRSPANMTREQASLLAAVLPNPRRLSAARPSDYVYRRAYQIRRQMEMLGGSRYLSAIQKD